jgi:hypothetical protein
MAADHGPDAGRRVFLKTACFAGICACARVGEAGASTLSSLEPDTDVAEPADLPRQWIAALLPALAALDAPEAREVLGRASAAHYEDLGMDATLVRFRGDLPAFLAFLRSEWDWIVDHDAASGVVLANENKDRCVCPLVPEEHPDGLGALCHCSEGFAERMFSTVTGGPVHAEVVESILRGGSRCRYRIDLTPAPTHPPSTG